ncbi:MAG: alpha-hydroxy acid oxidase [Rhodospirillaceae bacterium]
MTKETTYDLPDDINEEFMVLHEFAKAAREKLDKNIYDYVFGGAESETTVKRNRMAIETHALRPRVMRDVSKMDAGTDLFGMRLKLPVCLAPIGSLQQIAKGGGATAAKAAGRFGVAHMLSSVCEPGIEEVAKQAPDACRIFQLYVRGDQNWVDDKVRAAEANGYKAFAFTVDLDAYSRRERDLSKRFITAGRRAAVGEVNQSQFTWKDIDRIKKFSDLPIIIKGIATAEDAKMAVEHGVEVVYVSNHGGRQLDHGRGCLNMMPEVKDAVGDKASIWVDGGFMRGTDIVKAMCLGADIVGMGRMQALALAAAGEDGLVRMLDILEKEVQIALMLCGVNGYDELGPEYVVKEPPAYPPHQFSAFPLLDEGY